MPEYVIGIGDILVTPTAYTALTVHADPLGRGTELFTATIAGDGFGMP